MQKCKERFAYREEKNIAGRGATMTKRIAAVGTRMYLVIVSPAEAYRLLVPLNSHAQIPPLPPPGFKASKKLL